MKVERWQMGPGVALGAVSALLVVWFVWHDRGRVSPGPISAVHERSAGIDADDCSICHGERAEELAAACGACHADVLGDVASGEGFHGRLAGPAMAASRARAAAGSPPAAGADTPASDARPDDARTIDAPAADGAAADVPAGAAGRADAEGSPGASTPGVARAGACGLCHPEHHGAELALAGPAAFAHAGVADVESYDHAGLGFALGGRHAELGCESCHPNARKELLAKGEKRFGGLEQACASCHRDPHEGRLPDCRACHGEEQPFERVALFSHTARFPLTGEHAKAGCVDCHARGSPHAIEASAAAAATRDVRACADCHESPHDRGFLARAAAELAASERDSCERCHARDDAGFGAPDAELPRALHAASGFALVAPHAEVSCERCHHPEAHLPPDEQSPLSWTSDPASAKAAAAPGSSDSPADAGAFARAHPGRSTDDCAACHIDVHGRQFARGPFAGEGCLACHDRHAFAPPAFDLATHARTAFPLAGAHAAVPCADCHAARPGHNGLPIGGRRVFADAPTECSGCHADAHRGFFAARASEDARGCELCHAADAVDASGALAGFAAARERFDHAAATGFALSGAHAAAACEACHRPSARPDPTGRTLGFLAETLSGDPRACASCHADAHYGFFAARGLSACGSCHATDRFAPATDGFDHATTGYALTGAHVRAACASCHPALPARDAAGRSFARAPAAAADAAAACTACHADVHRGAFDRAGLAPEIAGARGCERCHTTEAFDAQREPFDHERWTGFALAGAHARADCAACHTPAPSGAFGHARGVDCASCHPDPHVGQFAESFSTVPGTVLKDSRGTDCARCHDAASPTWSTPRFDHASTRFALDATHRALACSACHRPAALPNGNTAVRYKPLGTHCGDCHAPTRKR